MALTQHWQQEVKRIKKESLILPGIRELAPPGPRNHSEPECILAIYGQIQPMACDRLARWCLTQVDLQPYGITAPSWSCSWRGGMNKEFRFSHWHLGAYQVAVFVEAPEPGRTGKSKSGYDREFIIPDMPVPGREPGDRAEFNLVSVLALRHFAQYLIDRQRMNEARDVGP